MEKINIKVMRRLIYFAAIILMSYFAHSQSLKIDNYSVKPGASISVYFSAPSTFADNAWIGIIPSNIQHGSEAVNDKHDVAYEYLKKRTSGSIRFKAPTKEGNYDFRMHDTDNNGKEVASVSFTVSKTGSQSNNGPINISQQNVKSGEAIQVNFNFSSEFPENAWIGIVPSHIEHGSEAINDKFDVSYQYLKKRKSGTLIFNAPDKEGKYDFRLNNTDDNGKEIAYVSFWVNNSKIVNSATGDKNSQALSINFETVKSGATIYVSFNALSSYPENAWIGIVPSNVEHGSEAVNDKFDVSYQYLKKRTSGTLEFKAPDKEGSYDFRMNDTDNNGKEIASVTFIVRN